MFLLIMHNNNSFLLDFEGLNYTLPGGEAQEIKSVFTILKRLCFSLGFIFNQLRIKIVTVIY